ncbi:hypothetical protein L6452_07158 [Arctium lappa]|uniref:Uncharacterized protein n=1 Tax=Arctium lappa TaxID=4217 RepID=A0ACB9EKY8_ARCLA|nr:hypothetical protein L6452_07158 [Arctium lappa]
MSTPPAAEFFRSPETSSPGDFPPLSRSETRPRIKGRFAKQMESAESEMDRWLFTVAYGVPPKVVMMWKWNTTSFHRIVGTFDYSTTKTDGGSSKSKLKELESDTNCIVSSLNGAFSPSILSSFPKENLLLGFPPPEFKGSLNDHLHKLLLGFPLLGHDPE